MRRVFFCQHGLPGHCENSNPKHYGPEGALLSEKGGGLFGYTDLYGGYAGGQAQYVRVPYANYGPRKVADNFQDEEVLFLTDIFPTSYTEIDWAGVTCGETVAVFGCGPVGLMAQKVARFRGAQRVIGVDIQEYRLTAARQTANSETINAQEVDPLEAIRELTDGRGADVCVDAVGMEADRNIADKLGNVWRAEIGSTKVLENCISAVRRGGFVSVVGVYGIPYKFPLGQIFDKGIKLAFGQAPVHRYINDLIQWIEEGRIKLDDIITHRLPLEKAPDGYEMFSKKKEGCVKVILKP
jgi:S-(hydroxymethyl)glutathione dehydrogenase / alcohol dehydrogenase